MKANYTIKYIDGNKTNIYTSASTKREIESKFNRIIRSFSKDPQYYVEPIRIGYAKVGFLGSYGMTETEYWIERA